MSSDGSKADGTSAFLDTSPSPDKYTGSLGPCNLQSWCLGTLLALFSTLILLADLGNTGTAGFRYYSNVFKIGAIANK